MTRRPPSPRADYAVFFPLQTRWKDMDAYGHINNVTYLSYVDTVVSLWQLEHGMGPLDPSGQRFLVAENGCTFHAEAHFPDRLEAGLRLGHLGRSSVRFEVGFFRGDAPLASSEGFLVHVLVNEAGRPVPIPDEARASLARLQLSAKGS